MAGKRLRATPRQLPGQGGTGRTSAKYAPPAPEVGTHDVKAERPEAEGVHPVGSSSGTEIRPLQLAAGEVRCTAYHSTAASPAARTLPEEAPVAFSYNRSTHAVMLATPADLEDFAIGFSLTEGIIQRPEEIEDVTIVPAEEGVELRMWLTPKRIDQLTVRQRRLAGPSGCGLCGLESLADAIRKPPRVAADPRIHPMTITAAVAALPAGQYLNQQTHAVHAAAFWHPTHGMVALREDIGRHNALDKLAGSLVRADVSAADGVLLLSSRISVELVQKAAMIGAPIVVAVSAPTALALRVADAAGITLIGIARRDEFEVFTHPSRISLETVQHVISWPS